MAELTQKDMEFLTANNVALRFQHDKYHQKFEQEGGITGDAYALGYQSLQGDSPEVMRANLRKVATAVFRSEVGSQDANGTFLLLKDVPGSTQPVRDRTYQDLHTVGYGARFTPQQVIGTVPVNHQALSEGIKGDSKQFGNMDAVGEHLTDAIITQIQQARLASPTAHLDAGVVDQMRQSRQAVLDIEQRRTGGGRKDYAGLRSDHLSGGSAGSGQALPPQTPPNPPPAATGNGATTSRAVDRKPKGWKP